MLLVVTGHPARPRHPVHVLHELGPMPPCVPLDLPGVLVEIDTTTSPIDAGAGLAAVRG